MSEAKEIAEATGVEVAKFAIDKLDSYLMAAQEVITKYGGDAVDLGLMALRVDAASSLLLPIAVSVGLLIYFKGLASKHLTWARETDKEISNDGFFTFCSFYMPTTIMVGISQFAIWDLFNLWAWVGIFYPEVYAVHKFLL